MSATRRSAWSVHGVIVEAVCGESDLASAAARMMEGWPRSEAAGADVRLELVRASPAQLAGVTPACERCDHWPGLEIGADGDVLWFRRERCGSLVITDLKAGCACAYVADRHTGEWAVGRGLSAMLSVALAQMLARRGLFSVHACAATRDGWAIIAAAERGAGKSTLAVSLARAGLRVMSDDRVLVRRTPAGVECLSWRGPLNLTPESAALFPELTGRSLPPGILPGKLAVSPEEVYHAPPVDSARPRLLLLPAVEDRAESEFEPLAPGEALAGLVPCSLFYAHRQVLPEHLAALRDVVDASRCYRVRLGRDVVEVGRRLAGLLAED